ncbi:MAG: hypothetical protein ACRYGP_30745 [Janthinobacterium lividum]
MGEVPDARERMGEPAERQVRTASLTAAIRAARVEVADRAQALGDLRDAELARLELLREMIEPVLAQVPPDIDLFDAGLVPGEHPRLFIDMVAFVEMARDRRTYRLVQDRRHVRAVLHEGEGVAAMVGAVTAYIARRLVEREQLLASLGRDLPTSAAPSAVEPVAEPAEVPIRRRPSQVVFAALRFAVDGLGLATLGALVWLGFHLAHGRMAAW